MERGPDNMNQGHGHVTPRPDGVKARCEGPPCCDVCARELANLHTREKEEAAAASRLEAQQPQGERKRPQTDITNLKISVVDHSEPPGPYILCVTVDPDTYGLGIPGCTVTFGTPTGGCYWPAVGEGGISWDRARAHAARIVACWNACLGMAEPAAEIARLRELEAEQDARSSNAYEAGWAACIEWVARTELQWHDNGPNPCDSNGDPVPLGSIIVGNDSGDPSVGIKPYRWLEAGPEFTKTIRGMCEELARLREVEKAARVVLPIVETMVACVPKDKKEDWPEVQACRDLRAALAAAEGGGS